MRLLPVRKVSSLLFFCFLALNASAQFGTHRYDLKDYNLGFSMGLNYGSFKMTSHRNTTDPFTGETVTRVELQPRWGIYLGLIGNLHLHDNIDLRFTPNVTLEQRDLIYYFDPATTLQTTENPSTKKVENSNINLPLFVKFKSNYYPPFRVWVGTGIQASFNLASNEKVLNNPNLIKTRSFDPAAVFSFGIDLYGEKIKLTPELRYTLGLSNIYTPIRTRFPTAISHLQSQSLLFILNFE